MALPYTKEEGLDLIEDAFNAARVHYDLADDHADSADYWRSLSNWDNAISFLIEAIYEIVDGGYDAMTRGWAVDEWYLIKEWLGEYTGGEEITWRTICEAWAANDFEGRAVTIAFIDRMRELIWDEPFSVVWAAKPEDDY